MQTLLHDLKYSFRGLRKSLGFSAVVVLTLSAGIGANTLVYSIVDGVILHPFPFPEPDRLVGIGTEWPRLNRELGFWETMSPLGRQRGGRSGQLGHRGTGTGGGVGAG